MATGVYNGFKGDLRDKSGQFVELLIRDGYLPKPTKCYLCGQTEGRIVYHLEDYTDVLNTETPMCFMSVDEIGKEIGANKKEVELLLAEGVFAVKNIKKYQFSKAWKPVLGKE